MPTGGKEWRELHDHDSISLGGCGHGVSIVGVDIGRYRGFHQAPISGPSSDLISGPGSDPSTG